MTTNPHEMPYLPHVQMHGVEYPAAAPVDFKAQFSAMAEGVYSAETAARIIVSGYNPTIIGYSHSGVKTVHAITDKIAQIQSESDKPLSVLHEIRPQQLEWIREFVVYEFEQGASVSRREAERMQAYRTKLRSVYSEFIALWCLDNGCEVTPIEEPDVDNKIQQDRKLFDGEESFGDDESADRIFYSAIWRDKHGLEVMERLRPDVITVGAYHALKYDMMLNRSGNNTFYYLNVPFVWSAVMRRWQQAHDLYRARNPNPQEG